jgi:hypothetical protein
MIINNTLYHIPIPAPLTSANINIPASSNFIDVSAIQHPSPPDIPNTAHASSQPINTRKAPPAASTQVRQHGMPVLLHQDAGVTKTPTVSTMVTNSIIQAHQLQATFSMQLPLYHPPFNHYDPKLEKATLAPLLPLLQQQPSLATALLLLNVYARCVSPTIAEISFTFKTFSTIL